MPAFVRWTASTAVAGGAGWIGYCLYHAALPRGCVGEECLSRPQRSDSPLGALVGIVAAVLLILAGVGLLIMLRRARQLGRLGAAGLIVAGTGAVLLALGGVLTLLTYPADFASMPAFVIPGVVLVACGLVLLAVALVRSRFLPMWASVSLMVGAALLLLANEQTATILFAVPFGLAWMLVGLALWRRGADAASVVAVDRCDTMPR